MCLDQYFHLGCHYSYNILAVILFCFLQISIVVGKLLVISNWNLYSIHGSISWSSEGVLYLLILPSKFVFAMSFVSLFPLNQNITLCIIHWFMHWSHTLITSFIHMTMCYMLFFYHHYSLSSCHCWLCLFLSPSWVILSCCLHSSSPVVLSSYWDEQDYIFVFILIYQHQHFIHYTFHK